MRACGLDAADGTLMAAAETSPVVEAGVVSTLRPLKSGLAREPATEAFDAG
jgi:hypothetical protein